MRLIPVIDLLDGQAVHAVRGDRAMYRPIRSLLCPKPDPVLIAKAFRDTLGLHEIYIADLNAIQNNNQSIHRDFIASLAHGERIDIILDAGISNVEEALPWLDRGIHKIIIGSETLPGFPAIQEFPERIEKDRLIFSLDIRADNLLSRCPGFAALSPIQALKLIDNAGWPEVVLVDLSRVGSEEGINLALVKEMRTIFPHLDILVGGGIANSEQLVKLRSMGVGGALVATALHRGTVTARDISALLNPGTE
jgi:phosphoribosylformimino-5-aminoimidazole carboxamide ribotide isomerase